MGKPLGFCGLNCAECEAYIATQAQDEAAKIKVLEKWRVEYDAPNMTLESITCEGCTSSGILGGYCHDCPVRACGVERGVINCAYCVDYETCETLQDFIAHIPVAKKNLEVVRAER